VNDVGKLLAAAESHLDRNELVEAEGACQRVLTRRPNDPQALMMSAAIAARSGNTSLR
jgi:Flp pilus assembly protein TadD